MLSVQNMLIKRSLTRRYDNFQFMFFWYVFMDTSGELFQTSFKNVTNTILLNVFDF